MSNFLKNSWTFWYDKPDPKMCKENWDQFLIRMGSFQKIENLWSLINNILSLTMLPFGSNLHLFKTGIEPKWEDIQNQNGGRWVLEIPKSDFSIFEILWRESILLALGTELDEIEASFVNGVVISVRKEQYKISIWTKSAFNRKIQILIGEKWKKIIQRFNFNRSFFIKYSSHKVVNHKIF
mmetsp:Transcript_17758/g.36419  ORF Transcript_17758/g.36419 Transcript_17758/m.36419 type:complete len:181 (+) Transcript_17758:7313-7855(+)